MAETIGLLGGSFNPIHFGHLAMAEAAQSELALNRVVLLPAGDPPHKSKELAPKEHRLAMTRLAAADRFSVSDREIARSGKTYTVDTLTALRREIPDADLVLIIGADTLGELHTWRDAPRVFSLCRFAVFSREGLPLTPVPGADIRPMRATVPGISATDIRRRVHRGFSPEGFTPRAVADYIGTHRLYDPPVQMDEQAIRKRLKADLPQARFRHTLGVAETAAMLATRHGFSRRKARLAGLLHDAAKGMTLEAMRRLTDDCGVPTDSARRACRELLHAPASEALARAVYGVTDPEVLRAIRYHNTGCPGMGMLDILLGLADMTEPNRKDGPALRALRALALEEPRTAARAMLRRKLALLAENGKPPHPDTAAALLSLEQAETRYDKEETR